jgi:hypothetical protein
MLAACGPRVRPTGPGDEPLTTSTAASSGMRTGGGPPVAIGEMCPDRAAGRPGVSVVLLGRGLSWSDDRDEIDDVVTRGQTPRFTVLGYGGKKAGVFTVAGSAEAGTAIPIASGAYAGSPPCAADEATREECEAVQKGCGLAIGEIGRLIEDTLAVSTGGVCFADGRLVVDLDGDGTAESFAAAEFLDAVRAPVDEVVGTAGLMPSGCAPRFAIANVVPGTQPKHWRGLDVVGVADLDGDQRSELVMQYRYGEKRTWAVYSASQMSTRIELVAEVEPWGQ